MILGQALDQPGRARLGIAVDRLGRCADRVDGPWGGPQAVQRRREIQERPVPELQPRPDRRLVAAVLDGECRPVV